MWIEALNVGARIWVRMRRFGTLAALLLLLLGSIPQVLAHANLLRSDPPANAGLETSPPEIRLWFTETLEPEFSRFTLRDSSGALVSTPLSFVDPDDATQLVMNPGALADDIYTVTWRVLSTDGHATEGSFAFGVGVSITSPAASAAIDETIPVISAVIRWLNLLSLSLVVGGVAFRLLVWQPAVFDAPADVERRMRLAIGIGWLMLGLATVLMLLLQASIATGTSLAQAATDPALGTLLFNARYGQIWLARAGLWLVLGVVLWRSRNRRVYEWLALAIGAGILLTASLYSHASAAPQDTLAAVAGNWLHLTANALWLGGLFQLLLIIVVLVRRNREASVPVLANVVAYFSNYARIAVVALILSGVYSAWLQVGSVDALISTVYGRALLVKLALLLPLLLIAGVNLLATQRQLRHGRWVWAGRLRRLVMLELVLGIGILGAVGVMTAIMPARTVVAIREAAAAVPDVTPFFEMQTDESLMAHLEIVPNTVGENQFIISLYTLEGIHVTDASLIRLRFDHLQENVGQSELRPVLEDDGIYVAEGANLSIPGEWRVRMTVQRPGQFDSVLDFHPVVMASAPAPVIDTSIPLDSRAAAAGLAGITLLVAGNLALVVEHKRHGLRQGLLASMTCGVGLVFLVTAGAALVSSGGLVARDAWARPMFAGMTGAVYLTIENHSAEAERLVGAETGVAASVTLHETRIENELARMLPVDALDIPPGGQVNIAPLGYHLMLSNLTSDLNAGDTFPLTLHFASGKSLTVSVDVRVN